MAKNLKTNHIFLSAGDAGNGGVAQYNHALLCHLAQLGYKVTYLQPRTKNPALTQIEQELGIAHIWIDSDEFGTILLPIFQNNEKKPSLLICSNGNIRFNLSLQSIARKYNVPQIIVEHYIEISELEDLFQNHIELTDEIICNYRVAEQIIFVSQENLNLTQQFFQLPFNKVRIVHYGRPSLFFQPKNKGISSSLRHQYDIPASAVVCMTISRIDWRKGFQYQIDALLQLKDTPCWENIFFVWIGAKVNSELAAQLEYHIADLGATERVLLLEHQSNVCEWLDLADIFILPSLAEGMPLSIMEAMAKGLPIIATAVSGIPEELGETGILIADPNKDADRTVSELVAAIQRLAGDPSVRAELGLIAQKRAAEMFTEKRMMETTMTTIQQALSSKKDYISNGLEIVHPDDCFPNMIAGDTDRCPWPYLRREIPHIWYVDRRQPAIGFLSRDEAHILYNNALQFKEKKALEIGCWMGWSACHLGLAGVQLDVIDPILDRPDFLDSIRTALTKAKVIDTINLVGGYSPQKVKELANQNNRKWSLIFIDGNHDTPGPLQDATVCEIYAEDDAMILFHDLASPDVSEGLDYLRARGWKTMLYQTMQIMGVAWRGNVNPVQHIPDPNVDWQLPIHLQHYDVSGVDRPDLQEFREIRTQVRPFTLLSEARLYSLYAITKQICLEDVIGNFVECGTFKGGAAALMASVIKRYSQRPRKLYAFDTFDGMPEPSEIDRHQGIHANDTLYGVGTLKAPIAENLNRIAEHLGVTEIIEPVQGLFADTLPIFRDKIGAIALLHADGDWYESTMDILNNLYESVVVGGLIQVDDYGHWEGCRAAIHDFERVRDLEFNLEKIDYTGVRFLKPAPSDRDTAYWHTELPAPILNSLQQACFNYSYKGIPMQKNPLDFALYPLLLWELQPKTIIEIGSCAGGSAVWFADMLDTFKIDGCIYSIDINMVTDVSHPRITFMQGDQNNLGAILTDDFLQSVEHPLLIIEDGAHLYETTLCALNFFNAYLQKGDYFVVEDGIISDLGFNAYYNGGPCRALKEFLLEHQTEYIIDRKYCDFFGRNLTWNVNGYLKKMVNPSLFDFSFREFNLIVFPDWNTGLDGVREALQPVIANLLRHPQRGAIALLVDVCNIEPEAADAFLADFLLEAIMQEDFDLEEEPQISLVHDLNETQWKLLQSKVNGRIALEPENSMRIEELSVGAIELIPIPALLGKIFEVSEV
jgi:cephalosporin hydroxylase/glycosyltransferase involved in cell wall biosynthesis